MGGIESIENEGDMLIFIYVSEGKNTFTLQNTRTSADRTMVLEDT